MQEIKTQSHLLEIRKVIAFFGTQKKLGDALGITNQFVSKWSTGVSNIPEIYAMKIEALTQGKFKAVNLLNKERKSYLKRKKK